MNFYTQIQHIFQSQYAMLLEKSKNPQVRQAVFASALACFAAGAYFGFNWYQKRKDMHAFAGLVEIAKAYDQAVSKAQELASKSEDEQEENPWEDVQLLLQAIATANQGSSLAPFFTMYQAQLALDADHDYDTACSLMQQGLNRMSSDNPYFEMFQLKYIKMLLDSPMQDVRDKAVEQLQNIATQQNGYCYQEALWILGQYQMYQGHQDKAIEAFKALATCEQSVQTLISNPWVIAAQEKLKALNIQ
ncbi:MAG: hypothetical protein ACXWL2_04260 [Candidatus Chromulinivorax sp.]